MSGTVVFGGTGLLGSALVRYLTNRGESVIRVNSRMCDATDQQQVNFLVRFLKPTTIYHVAGLVGGIQANSSRQYDFLMRNAQMAVNIIDSAVKNEVPNLVFTSSSCAYPANCPTQPMTEDLLLSGYPEDTNRGYALAKQLGTEAVRFARKMGLNYKTMVPCNLYGLGDNYTESGHVMAALIRRVADAKRSDHTRLVVWGDGTPRREFLHASDAAEAIVHAFENIDEPVINIGSGEDISIEELVRLIAETEDWHGDIVFDKTKPNGMAKKLLDVSLLRDSGWHPKISLKQGIARTLREYHELVD